MKGLSGLRRENSYHQPFAKQDNTICARLRRVFRGPPKQTPKPQYRDEKKYRHVPTHSASSFLKTATTPVMIQALVDQHHEPQLDNIRVSVTPNPVSPGHTPPPHSLI
ncbi:hypothetical protein ONS95_012343 [Cadophora gregata]|uniref:uncharacterized protein n=1 Tax=Cadophora gregata TaxID=51156 RepID=UPI0026DBD793|nr:uncharacterized protein ONS95_012343 [Cadophora gregata]KAK0118033.1 hypothetical protein ONS95_012343 [Cadophora gregata]KAK0123100.1 hypothetical protein ONS96_010106 [Cadophora gregata f. sp. sojae]